MALAIIGNSHVGSNYLCDYEIEVEDDDGGCHEEVIRIERVYDSGDFIGYRTRLATATYEKKMFAHIYQRHPSSEEYDCEIGLDTFLAFPLVYKCDANGKFTELMNTNLPVLERDVKFTGWIDCEITLKQNLNAGDYVFVGFYAGTWNPVWDMRPSGINGIPYEIFYWTGNHYYGYIQEMVRNGNILAYRATDYNGGDEYYSLYFQYYNSPIRTDYFRSVASSGRVNSLLARKSSLKRNKTETNIIVDNATKRLTACRIHFENKNINDFSAKNMKAIRNFLENETLQESSVRSAGAIRELKADYYIEEKVLRQTKTFRVFSENATLQDAVARFFVFICKVFSVGGTSDFLERSAKYKREENSESKTFASVVAGRLIFRAVATVFGAWDWLKSKIRNENCVVELFCPITDVLELECKI